MAAAPLDIQDLYRESFRLIMAEPGKVLGLSAIGLAPSWLASLLSDSLGWALVVMVVSLPLVALAHGGLVVLVSALRNGTTLSFSELLGGPRDGYVRITLALFVISLILGVGFVLLLVPGLVAAAYLWVAWPLVVLEDATAPQAIRRSVQMTDGHKLRITGVVLIFILINLGLAIAQAIVAGLFGMVLGMGFAALVGTATTALALTLITVSYHRLKGRLPVPVS